MTECLRTTGGTKYHFLTHNNDNNNKPRLELSFDITLQVLRHCCNTAINSTFMWMWVRVNHQEKSMLSALIRNWTVTQLDDTI